MNLSVITGERCAVIRLEGRLTAPSVAQFRQTVDELVAAGDVRVAVDLSATEFVDSSGLGALVGGLKSARLAGGDLRVTGITDQVRNVFKLTNLDRVLHDYPSPEAAFDAD
ncbi:MULTISPECIES: STAS domain-containing protein [Microbacterium]|uniref:Anti-sigma factor antagonist n=1 Tax=Microbacterium marmarense TaxID=3122051 RepID=A0ABU8LQB1_9MICO